MKRLLVAAVAVLALGLVSAAFASGTLSGTFKTTITNDPALGGGLNGTWVVKLKNDKYHVTLNGHPAVHGTYAVSGDQVTLNDHGKGACPTPGKYTFRLAGNKLTFKLISDGTTGNCIGRKDVLLGHTWTKV